jgi:adenine phosphoribosyltransferase
VQEDAIQSGQRVVILDDLLATGGTMVAGIQLLRKIGADVTGAASIIELNFLPGRQRLAELDVPFTSLVSYDD